MLYTIMIGKKHYTLYGIISGIILAVSLSLLSIRPAHGEIPEEGWLIWNSNRQDGRQEIYQKRTGAAHSGEVLRITFEGGQNPAWSPDGRWISFFNPDDAMTYLMSWDGSAKRAVFKGFPKFWLHDGGGLVSGDECINGDHCPRYSLIDPETGSSHPFFAKDEFSHLANTNLYPGGITHDGRWLIAWVYGLFGHGYLADNGTFTSGHSTVLLDLQDKSKIFYFGPGCLSTTPPSGDLIYHVSREGSTMPDIFRMKVSDRMTRASYVMEVGYADADWGHDYMPSISNDGQWMVYAASTGGHEWLISDYEIFAHRLGAPTDSRQRLTFNETNDSFPSLFIGTPGKTTRPDQGLMDQSPSNLGIQDGATVDLGGNTSVTPQPVGDGCGIAPVREVDGGMAWLLFLLCGWMLFATLKNGSTSPKG